MIPSLRPKIIVIVGPTASGKSDLALKLATKYHGEIISADSRQVYKGMDIGTGKVTAANRRRVPHHLLDVVSPTKEFTVAQYAIKARRAITHILKKKKVPIIVGGTGFYIDAALERIALPAIPPNKKLRAELEKKSVAALYAQLKKRDPVRARTIDRHNPRRLIRALEIVLSTKKPVPPTSILSHSKKYHTLWLGIHIPTDTLHKKIFARLSRRLNQGMIKEVIRLQHQGISHTRLVSFGLEYGWIARYLKKEITKKEMEEGLYRDIRRYATRQMTWFKRNKEIYWIRSPREARALTRKFLRTP